MPLPRGHWKRMSLNFPEHPEFMEVFPECFRIISSVVIDENAKKRIPIPVSYEDIDDGKVNVRLRPSKSWRVNLYRLEGDSIYWNHDGTEYRWDQIAESELPEWWPRFRQRALEKMDEQFENPGGFDRD